MVIRMPKELSYNFNSMKKKPIETMKKNQSKIMDTLTELKNNLQGINSRIHETESNQQFGR